MIDTGTVDGSDPGTDALGRLYWTWRDVQQTRIAAEQRGGLIATEIAPQLKATEDRLAKLTVKELKRQVIWPFLSQLPGLRGVKVAGLVALIRDPRRFPGQPCSEGHISAAIYPLGSACPASGEHGECAGRMQEPRRGTGARSIWHYCGVHVVDGRSPRKTKGQRSDWSPIGRTLLLMPDGIAAQIVRNRTEPYRGIYEHAKLRLQERAASIAETETPSGDVPAPSPLHEPEAAVDVTVTDWSVGGLRPFQVDAIARKVAAKAFVADLLIEWKRLLADPSIADETPLGEESPPFEATG